MDDCLIEHLIYSGHKNQEPDKGGSKRSEKDGSGG